MFQSEMVTTARRTRYFVLRALFAAGLLLCLWSCYEGVTSWHSSSGRMSIREAANLAGAFFQAFAWMTLIAAMVVTPAIAAGAIATERERRTIEYLFATDLSNAEIVLSKLFGKLLLVGKLIAVALPVLAIFRLLGGIPGNLLLVYFAALASTVTLLTVGSMCISVWTARARDAVVRVYLVAAVVFIVPILLLPLGTLAGWTGRGAWFFSQVAEVVGWLFSINPLWVLGSALSGPGALGMGIDSAAIWRMVVVHLGLTVVLATIAVLAVRRVHLRSISSPGSATERRRKWQLPRYRPALGNRPMLWKELFARTAATKLGVLGRVAVGLILLVCVGSAIAYYYFVIVNAANFAWQSMGEMYMSVSITITGLLGGGGVVLMGIRAAGLVAYEKERDCWLSLMSTPLTGAEIVGAKAAGNLYSFRWLLLPLAVAWVLQTTLSPQYIVAIPLHLFAIGATGLFATALGLYFSLKFESTLKSIGATVGTLVFVGGGYLLCCCVPMMIGGGDDDIMKVAMLAFIPFLQVVPGPLLIMEHTPSSEMPWMVFDYFAGTFGYAIAGIVILSTIIARFEVMVGRTSVETSLSSITAPPVTPRQPIS